MALQGKGFFIWKVPNAEGGNPQSIADLAASSGLTHVVVKIADGTYSYNVDKTSGKDFVLPVLQALRAKNIQVWGWHFVYGNDPLGEARKAIQRVQELNLDGYVIDAEEDYKQRGKDAAARQYMSSLRNSLPSLPVALCSYRFPSYHPNFPWKDFLDKCDLNMPQVYWVEAHNPGSQLERCVREFKAMTPYRPIFPTGIACYEGSWFPSESDIKQFLDTARNLNLPGANFWDWDECRKQLPKLFEAVARYSWPGSTPEPVDIIQQLINALNSHNINQIMTLYQSTALHIDSRQTIQGPEAIKSWYGTFLNRVLPDARFTLTGSTGDGSSRHFTWQATSSHGPVQDGNDTLGLVDNKISYHYTAFSPPAVAI